MKMKPFITGTAAYGPFTEESDIDIVMVYYDAENFKQALITAGIEIKEPNLEINPDYLGFIFEWAGRSFQIIYVRPDNEYHSWLYATNEMRNEIEYPDREQRIKNFNILKDDYDKHH
jgi:predicted nucleotidyltransferase